MKRGPFTSGVSALWPEVRAVPLATAPESKKPLLSVCYEGRNRGTATMRANSAKTITTATRMGMATAMRTGYGQRRTGDLSMAFGMASKANQSRNFPIPSVSLP